MKIIIDGREFKTLKEFHEIIAKKLDFPDYYGKNLSALIDSLSDVERPIEIVWENSKISKKNLGSTFDDIINIFKNAQKEDEEMGKKYGYNEKLLIKIN